MREGSKLGMDIWMASWSDATTNARLGANTTTNANSTAAQAGAESGSSISMDETLSYLWVYLVFALVALVASSLRSIALLFAAISAARTTFSRLIRSLSRAPVGWFDHTPTGRILNRVSSDQQRVDEKVPQLCRDTTDTLFRVLGTLVLIAIFSPVFLVLIPIISLFFYHLQAHVSTHDQGTEADGQHFSLAHF